MTDGNAIDFGDLLSGSCWFWICFKWSWRFRIMSELRINNITDRAGSSGPIIAGVLTVSSTSHMVMPSGPTLSYSLMIHLEEEEQYLVVDMINNRYPSLKCLDMVNITTTGDAVDYGDLSVGRSANTMGSNATRGIFAAGSTSVVGNA